MKIQKLVFTREWTDPAGFPVTVHSELEARKSLQLLHSETRDYINEKLLPEVNNNAARVIGDDARPGVRYRLGAENGAIYYEEAEP